MENYMEKKTEHKHGQWVSIGGEGLGPLRA